VNVLSFFFNILEIALRRHVGERDIGDRLGSRAAEIIDVRNELIQL
jgi:hypothetical protein